MMRATSAITCLAIWTPPDDWDDPTVVGGSVRFQPFSLVISTEAPAGGAVAYANQGEVAPTVLFDPTKEL